MKKLLLALLLMLPVSAHAGVPCTVPFNLTNGTTADATQVMANYNAILSCLSTSAAHSGANSDITSLTGMTTPLTPTQGGSPVFFGGTSTGSATAQVVTPTTPNSFSLTRNYTVVYTAGFTTTGATTVAVNGTAATNLLKQTSAGLAPLVANDIITGTLVMMVYDGTQYELITGYASAASLTATDQNLSGGANVTSLNLGSLSGGGTTTIDCGARPLQFFTNAGAQTLAAPTHDGSCNILMINSGTAVIPGFSGFTTNANTGEPFTTTNGSKFIITITEINGTATWFNKALQ